VFVDEKINQENQDDEEDQESSDEEDKESSGHDQDTDDEEYQPENNVDIQNVDLTKKPQRFRRPPERFSDYVKLAEDVISPITYEDCMKNVDRKNWLKAIKEEKDFEKKSHMGSC
jgi:hypothetical protein